MQYLTLSIFFSIAPYFGFSLPDFSSPPTYCRSLKAITRNCWSWRSSTSTQPCFYSFAMYLPLSSLGLGSAWFIPYLNFFTADSVIVFSRSLGQHSSSPSSWLRSLVFRKNQSLHEKEGWLLSLVFSSLSLSFILRRQ